MKTSWLLDQRKRTNFRANGKGISVLSFPFVSGTVQIHGKGSTLCKEFFQVIHADRSQNLGAVGESGVLKDLFLLDWRNAYSPRYHQATDVAWSDQATFVAWSRQHLLPGPKVPPQHAHHSKIGWNREQLLVARP